MELSARILCRPELAPAFMLAGFASVTSSPEDAPGQLRALAADPTVGIVLIDDHLFRALPAELVQLLDRRGTPVITPLPGPSFDRAGLAEEYVLEILRQAIGYRVRPR